MADGIPRNYCLHKYLGQGHRLPKKQQRVQDYKDILEVLEILLSRTRKLISKKMRTEWNTTLDVDYLDNLG